MNKYISLPYGIVDMAIKQGWVKELAYYCHIATLFSNKLIYNYNSRRLATLLKKSHGTVNSKVKFLVEKGLLSFDGGSLRCASINKLRELVTAYTQRETGSGILKFKIHNKILHTEWNLCSRVVINSINQQQHAFKKKNEVNAIDVKVKNNLYVSKQEYKKYVNHRRNNNLDVSFNKECMLSDNSISKQLKSRSISNVRVMMAFWISEGLISANLIKGRVVVKKTTAKQHSFMKSSEQFAKTYFLNGNVISFNQRTIELGSVIKPKSTTLSSNQINVYSI